MQRKLGSCPRQNGLAVALRELRYCSGQAHGSARLLACCRVSRARCRRAGLAVSISCLLWRGLFFRTLFAGPLVRSRLFDTDSSTVYLLGTCFLGAGFLRGRPIGIGTKASTSDRRTSLRPPISRADRRFRLISLAMACLDTPRIRAASTCEIQSSKLSLSLMVDLDTYFCYHPLR